jgi:hypothetical protein
MPDTSPLLVSVTELQDFLRCRWMWDTVSPNRQSLQAKTAPRTELHVGTHVHEGVAAPIFGKEWKPTMDAWYETEATKLARQYAERVGAPLSAQEKQRLTQSRDLATGMVEHYFEHYGLDSIAPLRYLAAEMSFRIPTGLRTSDGRGVFLVGTVDGVAIDEFDKLWIVERKTYNQKPDLRWLNTDHQMTGYAWAMQTLVGEPIFGILYDGLMKKVPQRPKVLQAGGLSREWNTSVSYYSYLRSILDHYGVDLDPNNALRAQLPGYLEKAYGPFLNRLRERDSQEQTPFFTRHRITALPQHQLRKWYQDAHGMLSDIAGDPRIYKNFRWEGCWDCWCSDLCIADQRGLDTDYLRETAYEPATHRPQYQKMLTITPDTVSSVEDLQRLCGVQ